MPKLTSEQVEQYYKVRLDPYKLRHSKGLEYRSICPLHGGSNPSQFWVNMAEGNYFCFSCQAKGGSAYMFEQVLLQSQGQTPNHDDVQRSLEQILGTPLIERTYSAPVESGRAKGWDRKQARDRYVYSDEDGTELYSVWRFVDSSGNKVTPPDHPCPCSLPSTSDAAECEPGCVNGRVWGNKGLRRVLYRLPDVMQSMLVFVVEGERNANDLSRALAAYITKHKGFEFGNLVLDRVAVTTNPGGASGWKKDHGFGRYFHQKTVVKLGDNDAAGRLHDKDACADIALYAKRLFTLALPVGEGEDISDYLQAHSIENFLKLLPARVEYRLPKQPAEPIIAKTTEEPAPLLVKPSQLVVGGGVEPDWLVQGLIERGARGLVVAPPKTGKSLLFLEMALCLATGRGFLGLRPYPRPVRCAIISREDGPVLVSRRLSQLALAKGLSLTEVDQNLVVNTEAQSSCFKIDNQKNLEEMADWLKRMEVEFVVIDVLSALHDQKENSSDDMTRVMQCFDELRRLSGCQICVIAHTNKVGEVKGSTAIAGWPDYIVRLENHPDDDAVKNLFVKTKASGSITPRTIRYWQSDDEKLSRIQLVEMRYPGAA